MGAPPEERTHLAINRRLCGTPRNLAPGRAEVVWEAPVDCAVDGHGLIHGGFTFGVADHAAMLAVNDPLVLLAAAEVRFVAPVAVGDVLVAAAEVADGDGRRPRVEVTVRTVDRTVFEGRFECVVARRHPLGAEGVEDATP